MYKVYWAHENDSQFYVCESWGEAEEIYNSKIQGCDCVAIIENGTIIRLY